jgi:nucleoid-associated protein YgaU
VSLGQPTTPPETQLAQLRSAQPTPYGAKPEASVQPMPVPVPLKSVPVQKDSWDLEIYQARTGDTYQSIARGYYKSENYGKALMFFNRDYDGQEADTSKRDPAAIVPGQKIYIPPERILKRDYSSVIFDQPAGNAASTGGPSPTAAAPAGAGSGTQAEKAYRVRGGGEWFLTIARNTLGNELRWPEIYILNRSFDSAKSIPGGTVLRMPADAKIDPADVP